MHLDCHSFWPPGLSGGSRRLAALLREYRGPERQKQNQRWLWVGRMLSTSRLDDRGREVGTASDYPEEAVCALSGNTPACLRFS